jgi:purine-binding chemotaxis protein CheW
VKVEPRKARERASLAGKYMSFELGDEVFGLGILDVREIIGLLEMRRVPCAPEFVRGVVNLRGRVIPVVDLRVQFGMPESDATEQTVIIVVQCEIAGRPVSMGVLVDRVLEVLQFRADQVEPPPELGGHISQPDFIRGVGKVAERVVFLLNITKVISTENAATVAAAAA